MWQDATYSCGEVWAADIHGTSVQSLSETLVQAFTSWRVDYRNSVLRHLGRTDKPVAVGLECRHLSGYWYSTFKPHNAGAPSATLAAGMPACRLQGCHARSLVAAWHFAIVPSQCMPSFCRCSWVTTTFHNEPNMRCELVTRTYSTFGDTAFAAAGPRL